MGTGFILKELLRERGMTIKSLAQKSGISVNTLYSITKRDSDNVDPVILKRISDALGCLPRDLVSPARTTSIGVLMADEKHRKQVEEWMRSGYTFSDLEKDLILAFSKMNDDGQADAVHFVQNMAQVPKYRKSGGGDSSAVDTKENE